MNGAKGYIQVEGLSSTGEGTCQFKIPSSLANHYLRYGPAHKFFDLQTVKLVLNRPSAIFEGLEREQQQDGLCYADVPDFIRREDRQESRTPGSELRLKTLKPPEGLVFLVFMNFGREIFDWRWEPMDVKHKGHPAGWEQRFNKKIWPT